MAALRLFGRWAAALAAAGIRVPGHIPLLGNLAEGNENDSREVIRQIVQRNVEHRAYGKSK